MRISGGTEASKDLLTKTILKAPVEIKVSAIIGVNLNIDAANIIKNFKMEWEK